jgi:hypothetical protein
MSSVLSGTLFHLSSRPNNLVYRAGALKPSIIEIEWVQEPNDTLTTAR